jgi:hypothetical protein
VTDPESPTDSAPNAVLRGCDHTRRTAKQTLLALYPEMFRNERQTPAGTQTRTAADTANPPLHGRPDAPGLYDLYTSPDEGAYWAARLALSTDGAWKIDEPALTPPFKTGASGDTHPDDARTGFRDRVRDLVRESRDSDDLLIALDILLGDDCYLRPATPHPVPPCCTTHGIVGRRSSSKHD